MQRTKSLAAFFCVSYVPEMRSKRSIRVQMVKACAGLLALACGTAAFADPDTPAPATTPGSSDALAEIVVTARQQTESLMKVPDSVSTVSGADLEQKGITEISDLGKEVTSVNFAETAGGGPSLSIRGVGSSTIDTNAEQTVSTVIDGVQTSQSYFTDLGLTDIGQVEILKGPQSLFFGKSSPAGVLSLDSRAPTTSLESYVKGGYEFEANEATAAGAVSGPLTDQLLARVAFRYSHVGGWLDNDAEAFPNPFAAEPGQPATLGGAPYRKNDSQKAIGRVTIEYLVNPDFTVTWRVVGGRKTQEGIGADTVTVCPGIHSDFEGTPIPGSSCSASSNHNAIGAVAPNVVASDPEFATRPYYRLDAGVTSLTLDYSPGPLSFTAITGYATYTRDGELSYPASYPVYSPNENYWQLSQELRAVTRYDIPINFTGGIFLETTGYGQRGPEAIFPIPAAPGTNNYTNFVYAVRSTGDSYSTFAQARWTIDKSLELDVGARYSIDIRRNKLSNDFVNPNFFFPLEPVGQAFSGEEKDHNISPDVTLNFTPLESTLFYASFREGYKAGDAASPGLLPASFDPATGLFFKPEKIQGFEVGIKTQQLDDRLRITAAAYTYKYRNLQISNFDATTVSVQPLGGDLKTSGGEFSTAFKVTRELTVNGNFGYVHSRYSRFAGVACYPGQSAAAGCVGGFEDLSGQQNFRSPNWTGNFGVDYATHAVSGYILGFNAGMSFSSGYFTEENNNPASVQKAYQTYDAGMRFGADSDQWNLALIGRNLGNERYIQASTDQPDSAVPGSVIAVVSRPREIILEGTVRFGTKQ